MQFKLIALFTFFTLAAAGPIVREASTSTPKGAVTSKVGATAAKVGAAVKSSKAKSDKSSKSSSASSSAVASAGNSTVSDSSSSSNSSSVDDSSSADSSSDSSADNSTSTDDSSSDASSTSTAAAVTRTRPCDQGDQSLAAALQANVVMGLGLQAATVTLQGLVTGNGAASDISDAQARLAQFVNTSTLQIQTAAGIADSDSFAQPQLQLLASSIASQTSTLASLTGTAADNSTLATLLDSFVTSTGDSQDGVNNALIDCFLPLTTLSG